MRQRSNFLFLLGLVALVSSSVPAFAGNPHSTPGLDASALTGMAAAGYMGFQAFKAHRVSRQKDE